MRVRRLTLTEAVLIAFVLFVLVGMLSIFIPHSWTHRPSEKQKRWMCAGNQKQIGLSLLMYSGDFDGYFPNVRPNSGSNFRPLVNLNYIQQGFVWSCPSRAVVLTTGVRSAFRYVGSGLRDDNARSPQVSLAYDKSGNHPGNDWCNVLYVDGHVEGGKPGKWSHRFNND
jgi:prepilin-type processing-associated H-X9-DG protein